MEELKNFFSDIKSRLNSPLIGSFILSWFIINWRIPIVLLFYKQDEVCLDGYQSFQDVIYQNTNLSSNFYYPFATALFYTFIFPIIRNWIKVYQAWVYIGSQNKIYELTYNSKTYLTKIEELNRKHREEMLEYDSIKNQLQNKSQESHFRGEDIARYRTDIDKLEVGKKELTDTLDKISKANDAHSMDGKWKVTGLFEQRSEVWSIKNGKIYISDKHELTIESIVVDTKNGKGAIFYYDASNSDKKNSIFFDTILGRGFYSGRLLDKKIEFDSIPS
ncbi:hypothetical protein [Mucilaginibacter pedocola]|uniref:Uncharacterized protein n=1 Tax=Mucilaginibacter pedocola TaxID=1792845 RepID=A0A1S9PKX7_9SPHI|nr:hypothetical protein [Mucilaginibacter pedocola]OOQ61579.1 hypothetical protein BC343_00430 [Mucilaginibacter pedocola]